MIQLFYLLCMSQGFDLAFEGPICDDITILGGLRAGIASYEVTGDAETYTHKVELTKEGKTFKIVVSRDLPQPISLSLEIKDTSARFSDFLKAEILAPFGKFNVGTLDSTTGAPTILSSESIEVSYLDQTFKGKKYDLLFPSEKKGSLTVVSGLGPMGVFSADIWRGDKHLIYRLAKLQ